jgi:hypothetical protein
MTITWRYGAKRANKRYSAYSFRRATIAYPWHPLFGRTLQVSRNRRGKDLTCIYTDERPDLARELPNWMFEEKYCAGMSLGPPQVRTHLRSCWRRAANRRSGVHDRVLQNRRRRFVTKRRKQDRRQLALALEPRRPTTFPAPPSARGLIEALADLLLEALGERTTAVEGSKGGGHKLQDHG